MYGKSFESKYTGSMIGAGFNVFAVWDYITTNARAGVIELNPKLLAFTLAGTREGAEDEVRAAIEFLCAPDTGSRSKEEEGRRMIQEGEYQYRVVNWDKYQAIRNEVDRREYNRRIQAKYRAAKKMKRNVPSVREQWRIDRVKKKVADAEAVEDLVKAKLASKWETEKKEDEPMGEGPPAEVSDPELERDEYPG